MQVKVFEAKDMAAALKMVKESLGADALILSTRTVRKGRLGRLGRESVEVTAAIDSPGQEFEGPLVGNPYVEAAPPVAPEVSFEEVWRRRKVIDPLEEEVQEIKGQLANLDVEALRREISGLKDLVKSRAFAGQTGIPAAGAGDGGSPLLRLIGELVALGVEGATAEVMVRREFKRRKPKEKISVRTFLAKAIANSVRCSGPFFGVRSQPRRVALLGPTGVGKTTTVAKLAADYLLNRGRSLALVTIDIYRIAAAEQLKVYGEIMNVPVDVARTPQEFKEVLQRHGDKELVLIDTAGRSPRDRKGLEALYGFIGPESGVENHLVLSAATGERENHLAVRHFSGAQLQSLIMTKLDECESLGSLLNLHFRHGTPISYLTDGQRVPEDLRLAEAAEVGKIILATRNR